MCTTDKSNVTQFLAQKNVSFCEAYYYSLEISAAKDRHSLSAPTVSSSILVLMFLLVPYQKTCRVNPSMAWSVVPLAYQISRPSQR